MSVSKASSAKSGGTLRRIHLLLRSNWISSTGAASATLALLAFVTLVALNLWGDFGGPYVGLLTVVVLPVVFVGVLALIPLGLFLYRRRLAERLERLADRPLPLARAVAALTLVNFAGIEKVLAVKDNAAVEKRVRTGRRFENRVEIVEGLALADRIVLQPGNLVSGEPVEVIR